MKVHVAYVLLESNLGGKVLGVRVNKDKAKELCQTDYNISRPDTGSNSTEEPLEWTSYQDNDGGGEQAIPLDSRQYYVEETDLEVQSRDTDDGQNIDWKYRQVLHLTVENGRLAQMVVDRDKLIQKLARPYKDENRSKGRNSKPKPKTGR